MELYGFYTFTHHGWAPVLRVMSPEGATAVAAHIEAGDYIVAETGPGQLAKYSEQRGGALKAMIERYGIQVLDRPAWESKKAELGAAIYR